MENAKELIEASLNGEPCTVTPEQLVLDGYRMTSQTKVPEETFLFKFFGNPCFPRGELTTITGSAKSGKTFFTSMVMACCQTQQVMALERTASEPLKVMWYDTEQSRSTTKEIFVRRVGRMIGRADQTDDFPDEQFFVFNVRAASIKERHNLIGPAIATYQPDIVILDGISDLLTDINDGPQATELIAQLVQLAEEYDCNITTVIHLNRTGEKNNLRGWLGSVMLQKSYEAFCCSNEKELGAFSVEHLFSRKWHCQQRLFYEIDNEGIPMTSQKLDLQPRDKQGKFMGKAKNTEVTDKLNRDYIIEHPDHADMTWEWDLRRLFTDAMGSLPSMGNEQMEQAVMELSHIRQKQYYYKVLAEAEQKGVIRKVYDRYKRVAIVLQPPR